MGDRMIRNLAAYGLGIMMSLNYSNSEAASNIRRSYEPCSPPINLSVGDINIPISLESIDEILLGDLEIKNLFTHKSSLQDYFPNEKKSPVNQYNASFYQPLDPIKESLNDRLGITNNPQKPIRLEYKGVGLSISKDGDMMFLFKKEF